MKSTVALLVFSIWLIPQSTWAYLDPGTGSMILQAIAGGVAGLLFLLKLYWKKIKSFFRKRSVP